MTRNLSNFKNKEFSRRSEELNQQNFISKVHSLKLIVFTCCSEIFTMSNKAFEVQNQIRQSVLQTHESIKGIKQWEAEMKEKELELQKQQSSEDNNVRPSFGWRNLCDDFVYFHFTVETNSDPKQNRGVPEIQ